MSMFSQSLIQGLINPSYADKLGTAGMLAGSMPDRLRLEREERAKEEAEKLQAMQQQSAIMSAYGMAQQPGGSNPSAAMAAMQQGVPGLKAQDMITAATAGRAAASDASKGDAAQKRQQGIETITQIATRSDVSNPNVQRAIQQVALNYGLTKDDLAMVLPASGKVTRGTGTVIIDGKPTLVNFTYGADGRVINREVLGEKPDKPAVELKQTFGGDRGEYFKGVETEDVQQAANGTIALQTLPAITQARQLITETPEVFGAGANVFNDMRRGSLVLLDVMGVPKSDPTYIKMSNQTSAADLSRTLTQEFVRPRMEATKGAISNREFETFIESVPNLLQTPEGYSRVLDYIENSLNAQIVYSENLDDAYQTQEGPTPSEFKRKWSKFSSEVPLGAFNRDELEQVWQTYNSSGNMANVKFTLTNPVSNEATIVSLEQLKKRANKKGVSVNAFIAEFKNNGQLGLLQ